MVHLELYYRHQFNWSCFNASTPAGLGLFVNSHGLEPRAPIRIAASQSMRRKVTEPKIDLQQFSPFQTCWWRFQRFSWPELRRSSTFWTIRRWPFFATTKRRKSASKKRRTPTSRKRQNSLSTRNVLFRVVFGRFQNLSKLVSSQSTMLERSGWCPTVRCLTIRCQTLRCPTVKCPTARCPTARFPNGKDPMKKVPKH